MDWVNYSIFFAKAFIEIAILFVIIYSSLSFIRGTRSSAMLIGIITILASLSVVVYVLKLEVLEWLLNHLLGTLPILFVIIFQSEIRSGLGQLGVLRQNLGKMNLDEARELSKSIIATATSLSEKRIGSIIAIERNIGLRTYVETGTTLNAKLTPELLSTIFFPNTTLHDGGVIIRKEKVVAAGCIFPLATLNDFNASNSDYGTRHRAGLGLSEETDAFIIITSEETGRISIACNGKLKSGLSPIELGELMMGYFSMTPDDTHQENNDFLGQNCDESLNLEEEGNS